MTLHINLFDGWLVITSKKGREIAKSFRSTNVDVTTFENPPIPPPFNHMADPAAALRNLPG